MECLRDNVLLLYVQPGASKSGWAGKFGDPPRLKLKVSSPPVDGEANEAVVAFVVKFFGLKKMQVELIRGEKSRMKDLRLSLSSEELNGVKQLLQDVWQGPA